MIKEGDKIKLKTGEIAFVAEVLEEGVMYIAEVFTKDGISVDHVEHKNITSVFVEMENPIAVGA